MTSATIVVQALRHRRRTIRRINLVLLAIAIATCCFFVSYDTGGYWHIIGRMRLTRLAGLVIVATALSVATVVFQAVTRNRILSPSVMGFDSMFNLVATGSVFLLGSEFVFRQPSWLTFIVQASIMTVLAVTMSTSLIRRGKDRIHLLVLVGIVLGTLFRSLTVMMQSIMDPNEFLSVQGAGIASFAIINEESLLITAAVTAVMLLAVWWGADRWNLLIMGRQIAVPLGLRYAREVKLALAVASILVACATALVGPLMFFGLLIVNIAVYLIRTDDLRSLVVASSAIGISVLVGGQAVMEFVINQATVLPVVIEFIGGILLLIMIAREVK